MITVKVWDLLAYVGKEDTIAIEKKFPDDLPGLVEDGLVGEVHLQSINQTTILVTLKHLRAKIKTISDISCKEFIREVVCPESCVKFSLNFDETNEEARDEIFPIDPKNNTIDLEPRLVQCIRLQDPVVFCTEEEARALQNLPDDEQEYEKYV